MPAPVLIWLGKVAVSALVADVVDATVEEVDVQAEWMKTEAGKRQMKRAASQMWDRIKLKLGGTMPIADFGFLPPALRRRARGAGIRMKRKIVDRYPEYFLSELATAGLSRGIRTVRVSARMAVRKQGRLSGGLGRRRGSMAMARRSTAPHSTIASRKESDELWASMILGGWKNPGRTVLGDTIQDAASACIWRSR